MPIYEYRCESCGAELEKLQKISDPPLRECPECGQEKLVKLVSASSFRLKGSGWYETDFKTGKKKNGAADSAAEAGNSNAASERDAAPKAKAKENAGSSDAAVSKTVGKEGAGTKGAAGSDKSGKAGSSSD